MLNDPQFNIFYHAPVLLIVLARLDDAQAREDCCLAAQTLMLVARCWPRDVLDRLWPAP